MTKEVRLKLCEAGYVSAILSCHPEHAALIIMSSSVIHKSLTIPNY